ncbi:glycosyltransferase family 4 protein [Pseudomonas huanghezhanensis]|uniref:glycosyltransferase family 4 protein n=1 Tax=Pseudomonas huanghezhanensis TaxID=3002903 RepID=UPI00228621BB|nr:glycosyltransferase family 4 protein [Pseudomonas sp. BSw22131]
MRNQRNILLSAIACSPFLGSEDGVGWHWAVELENLGHRVTVITRTRFKADIERHMRANPQIKLEFVYVDWLPGIDYTGSPSLPSYAYIYVWQWLAFLRARQLLASQRFDLVHHVTFAGIRLPSFMGGLGIPFIFGPVGGGEETPPRLLVSFPLAAKAKEWARRISNRLVKFDPLMRYTMGRATVIGLTTKDSLPVIPVSLRHKTVVCATIGVEARLTPDVTAKVEGSVVLYAGRFLYWKGMQLGIRAFAKAVSNDPSLRLVMVGEGPALGQWQALAKECGVEQYITWHSWVDKEQLVNLYQTSSLFLFPSLHDSGGMVVLEAASCGLPVLCLDIGGPGEMVGPEVGIKVNAQNASEAEVVAQLAAALESLTADKSHLLALSDTARHWAGRQSWNAKVAEFYDACEPFLLSKEANNPAIKT